MVTIAYWDTEQRARPPRLLGEYQGTPTIRLFKPKKKQNKEGSFSQKVVVDYRQERKVRDLQQFVEDQMPNYVERIAFGEEDLSKVDAKAQKYGLTKAIFFTSKPKTTVLLKYMSTEFRRRLLIVQVPPTTKNQAILEKYGLSSGGDRLPALIVETPNGEQIAYAENDFSKRKVERFLRQHAAKDAVYKPVAGTTTEGTSTHTDGGASESTTPGDSSSTPHKDKKEATTQSGEKFRVEL